MGHGRTTGRLVKIRAKTTAKHWVRPLTLKNPYAAIPDEVLKQLASENLPDKESYSRRLNELLKENSNG